MKLEYFGYGLKNFFDENMFKFKLELGFSHIVEYVSPFTFFLSRKLYGKKYLLVASMYKHNVSHFVYNLFKIKPYLKYKFKGFKLSNEDLKLKTGKKKQFF